MTTKDYAEVSIKPPILFVGALVLGYLLTKYFRIGPGFARPDALGLTVGLLIIVAGFCWLSWPFAAFALPRPAWCRASRPRSWSPLAPTA